MLSLQTCVLKVNSQCETCKRKVMEVLQSLRGAYNITIDADQGTVKVTGRVNPNVLLRVLERYGKHAEVKWIRFEGEVRERGYNYYGENGFVPSPYHGMPCNYPVLGGGYDYPPYGGGLDHYPLYDTCSHIPPPPLPMYRPPTLYHPVAPPFFPVPLGPQPMPRVDSNYESCMQM
ncbi:heavy metal-associated isoprenylated plant protein 32 [Juglans microcarpa x Juglans regia]|uniref:heavy metal-associated isoprenylated plant protein 32 n=1 Tax=Juglans microcarpa x Juglans regia TaxID=2249226 RepID=UPI001B7F5719|nr:heavy metal-associated isoprenylated plant protein 32 [Juglans microcarpa x Juglans regia]